MDVCLFNMVSLMQKCYLKAFHCYAHDCVFKYVTNSAACESLLKLKFVSKSLFFNVDTASANMLMKMLIISTKLSLILFMAIFMSKSCLFKTKILST